MQSVRTLQKAPRDLQAKEGRINRLGETYAANKDTYKPGRELGPLIYMPG